jgi:hypothetical protein
MLSRFGPRPFALGFCLLLACALAPAPVPAREASTTILTQAAPNRGTAGGAGGRTAKEGGTTQAFGKLHRCKPGPWGDMEYYYIYLEPPDRVVDDMVLPEPSTKWCFPGGTEASVRAILDEAEIPVELQNYLLDAEHRAQQGEVLTVFPPLPDLLAMTPTQRAALYGELAKNALNKFCAEPIVIPDNDAETWLAQSRLRPELREMVMKMIYTRGETLCFSDLPAVMSMVQSEKEARDVVQTLWRKRTLMLQLNVRTQSEFTEAVRYWSGDGRNTEVESIIVPAADSEGIERLDCVHLLPALPRRYLYSYPTDELTMTAKLPDCNWTSLNFFGATPFIYHTDAQLLTQRLREAYDAVEMPYRLGDVLVLMGPGDIFLHSCVFLADDIVYSKNGESRLEPWLLTKLDDVKRGYAAKGPVVVKGFRMKREE